MPHMSKQQEYKLTNVVVEARKLTTLVSCPFCARAQRSCECPLAALRAAMLAHDSGAV